MQQSAVDATGHFKVMIVLILANRRTGPRTDVAIEIAPIIAIVPQRALHFGRQVAGAIIHALSPIGGSRFVGVGKLDRRPIIWSVVRIRNRRVNGNEGRINPNPRPPEGAVPVATVGVTVMTQPRRRNPKAQRGGQTGGE